MRALTLVFLCLTFVGPTFAQLRPLNPPPSAPGADTSPAGPGQFNADGKIQIGYDKRADYPTIKQPTGRSDNKSTAAKANTNSGSAQNFDGDNFDDSPDAFQRFDPASRAAAAKPAVAAKTTKPRSDSALKSDNSPAREAAAAAQAQADAKAAADKAQADALGAAIAAAQKAGALPTGGLPALPKN